MPDFVNGQAVSFGEGTLVGVDGETEHSGALRPPDARQADAGRDWWW